MKGFGMKAAVVSGLAMVLALGCGDDRPKSGNGVNDVRAACEIRANWNRTDNDCSLCESAVTVPACDCEALAAFAGACLDQQNARQDVCAADLDKCVFGCDRTDCNCIEGCYAEGDACKRASAARDGCVAEACAPHCK